MKTRITQISLLALAAVLAASAQIVSGQVATSASTSAAISDSPSAPARMSYGVADVLKLSNAHLGDEAIVAFVGNSGMGYNLSVNEIIYLKRQGVSDRVITAMLDQHKTAPAYATQTIPDAPVAPASIDANAPGVAMYAPAAAQPATAYAQPAPVSGTYAAASSPPVYAFPGYAPDYTSYPYYGGSYGYGYPGISVGVGFGFGSGWLGNGWYGGGYRGPGYWGGYRGGYYGGGGYHGGGYHGGYHR